MTDKDVLPEKDLLVKAATTKTFQYSSLVNELNKQTDITKKQYKGLDDVFELDKNGRRNRKYW